MGIMKETPRGLLVEARSIDSNPVPQLKREWGQWSILAFASLTLCSWETSGALIQLCFVNGGAAALVYGCIVTGIGMISLFASLAEMSSMYPVAGSVYVWSAQFAPPQYRAFVSYLQGWITMMAWQCGSPAVAYIMAIQIQGLALLLHPSLEIHNWHTCLIMVAILSIACAIVTFGRRLLLVLVSSLGLFHVLCCFCIIIFLLLFGTRASDDFVWENVQSGGGWSNRGVSFCVGFLTMCFALVGSDACAHLAEETSNAPIAIPRAMVYSVALNLVLAFAFIIVALYSVKDVKLVMETAELPLLEIFRQSSIPTSASIVLAAMILIPYFGSIMTMLASSGRLTWAFARDGAFHTSEYFSKIDPDQRIPLRAIMANITVSIILSLVVIASPVAFNALVSFVALTFFASYLIPVALFLHYRLVNNNIAYGPWRLGKLGVPINILSLCLGSFIIIFLPFPSEPHVTWGTMNYAGPILGVLLLLATANWFIWGRKHFKGPIVHIRLESHSNDANGMFTVMTREPWILE